MVPLILALFLSHFASGNVIPEYNNTSAQNAAVVCEISPFGTLPTPLLIQSTSFIYPASAGQTILVFAAGETVDFACPGGTLVLEGVTTTLEVATGSCVSGGRFIINNARYLWRQVQCTRNPTSTARYTGRSCEANGTEAEIGFAVTASRFVRTLLVCFDPVLQQPIYTYYDLIPAINQQITGTPRPGWVQGSGFFSASNVNTLYTRAVQRTTINGLLGYPAASTDIIQNNNYFLSRGHLTARSDFFYAAQQNSTFYFLNALPQWQTFNGFSWNDAEIAVQDYAESNDVHLQVWTGGYGVTTLPHATTGVETELYLFVSGTQRAFPVPEIYWKVVYNPITQRGVALIGVNNPYKTWDQIDRFCDDRSDLLPWLTWQKDNQGRGLSWACTVTAFRRIVKNFPEISIKGLLF